MRDRVSLIGVGIDALGASILIVPMLKTEEEIRKEAGTYFDFNPPMMKSLKESRKNAFIGMGCLLFGFYIQFFAYLML